MKTYFVVILMVILIVSSFFVACKSGGGTEPGNQNSTIAISSTPSGALVYLDGNNTSKTTPVNISTTPGKHSVKLILVGYKDWTQDVELTGGQIITVSAVLLKGSVFEEGFESGVGKWTLGTCWFVNSGLAYEGVSALHFYLTGYSSEFTEAAFLNVSFDFSNVSLATLKWWAHWGSTTAASYGDVIMYISTNDGKDWVSLGGFDGYSLHSSAVWGQKIVDLKNYIGYGCNKVKFKLIGHRYGGFPSDKFYYDFWIDNIVIQTQ